MSQGSVLVRSEPGGGKTSPTLEVAATLMCPGMTITAGIATKVP